MGGVVNLLIYNIPARDRPAEAESFSEAVRSIGMSGMDMIGAAVNGMGGSGGARGRCSSASARGSGCAVCVDTRYQNRLYRFLLRLVHDKSEAEDLFQQTWVHVAEKIRHFDPSRNFDAWLFTVARNLAIDHLRRVRPASLDQPISEDESQGTALDRLVANDPAPLDRVLANERATGWHGARRTADSSTGK